MMGSQRPSTPFPEPHSPDPLDSPPFDIDSASSSSYSSHLATDQPVLSVRPYVIMAESDTFTPPPPEYSNDYIPTAPINVHGESEPPNSPILGDVQMNEESNDTVTSTDVEHRRREHSIDEPPAKIRKLSSPQSQKSDDQDGETCPICLDAWGNSGDHRLVALKCGHLFGAKCVERWLKAQPAKDRSCPTCKAKSSARDIRFIYARKLVAADTAEITALQTQLSLVQSEKCRTELELQKTKMAHRVTLQQLQALRDVQRQDKRVVGKSWRFALEKNLEVCKDGGCRVLAYNCRTYELYVSQKSTNNLFPGFGVRKVSCVDYKLNQFIHLHPKPIRGISYSQQNDMLLSVGLDNTARIVERGIASTTVQAGSPLWTCTWDVNRDREFYVGGAGGTVLHYDLRNTGAPLQRLLGPAGHITPVVSLASTDYGLLSCQLNSCWLWEAKGTEWSPKNLPIDGPFMSMCFDAETRRVLLSCRPKGLERSRLLVARLKADEEGTLCEVEQTVFGSNRCSQLSRAAWVKVEGACWLAGYSESDSALILHGLDGSRTMSLPATDAALDICSAEFNGETLLAAVSESRLRLYKAKSQNVAL